MDALNYDPTDPDKMRLPGGTTCGDCVHISRCTKLVKTRMAKAVLDSGWGMLKQMLQYKGERAGRSVQVVNEAYTTRACSSCGQLTGPGGLRQLAVRAWHCSACGTEHERDVNAAKNIAMLGSRQPTSVCGNDSKEMNAGRKRGIIEYNNGRWSAVESVK